MSLWNTISHRCSMESLCISYPPPPRRCPLRAISWHLRIRHYKRLAGSLSPRRFTWNRRFIHDCERTTRHDPEQTAEAKRKINEDALKSTREQEKGRRREKQRDRERRERERERENCRRQFNLSGFTLKMPRRLCPARGGELREWWAREGGEDFAQSHFGMQLNAVQWNTMPPPPLPPPPPPPPPPSLLLLLLLLLLPSSATPFAFLPCSTSRIVPVGALWLVLECLDVPRYNKQGAFRTDESWQGAKWIRASSRRNAFHCFKALSSYTKQI